MDHPSLPESARHHSRGAPPPTYLKEGTVPPPGTGGLPPADSYHGGLSSKATTSAVCRLNESEPAPRHRSAAVRGQPAPLPMAEEPGHGSPPLTTSPTVGPGSGRRRNSDFFPSLYDDFESGHRCRRMSTAFSRSTKKSSIRLG